MSGEATRPSRLDDLSPVALALLRMVSLLDAAPVKARMFDGESGGRHLAEAAALVAREREAPSGPPGATVADALAELARTGLVEVDGEEIRLSAGSRDPARDGIPGSSRRSWVERALNLVNDFAPDDADDPRTWKVWDWLAPHAARAIELAEAEKIPHPTGVLMGDKLGVYWFLNGRAPEAEALFRRAIEIEEAHFGPDHPHLAVALNNLAVALNDRGAVEQVLPLRMRVVKILIEHRKAEPAKYATALHNLAGSLADEGRFAESEDIHRRALAEDLALFGENHQAVARDLRGLAALLRRTGRGADAATLYRRALAADERALGADHPALAADLRALAATQAEMGLGNTAPLFERALAIDEAWRPAGHPDVLGGLLLVAEAHGREGAPEKALAACETLIGRCESSGIDHTGLLKRACGRLAGGEPRGAAPAARANLALRALRAAERRAGWDGMDSLVATVIGALSGAGLHDQARALGLDVAEGRLRKATGTSPESAGAWNALAVFLKNERADHDAAEQCYRKALALAPNDAGPIANFALFLTSVRGRHDEAEQHYRRAIELDSRDANTLANFAFFLQNVRGMIEEAEKLYRMSIDLEPRDANSRANHASLLIVTGRLDAAGGEIAKAWELKAGRHDRISTRPLVLQAAVEALSGRDPSRCLGRLKELFARGIAHAPWCAGSLLAHLRERLLPGTAALFAAIVEAVGDRKELAALEEFAAWKECVPVPLEAPWREIAEI